MRYLFLFLITILSKQSLTQNLIYNGSIEELDSSCVYSLNSASQSGHPTIARNIFSLKGSPDILNNCLIDTFSTYPVYSHVSIPTNIYGFQHARTGNGYLGIWIDLIPINTKKISNEVISFRLNTKLIASKKYCFQLRIVHSEGSSYSTDAIEAILSSDSILPSLDSVGYYSLISNIGKGFISDTVNWWHIMDTINATSYEKYLHIGKFQLFNNSNITYTNYSNTGFSSLMDHNSIVYIIDDIALWPCDTIAPIADAGNDTIICKGDSVLLGTHNYNDHFYSWWHDSTVWFHGNTQIQRDEHIGRIWVKPESSKWYYLQATDFKYDKTRDSVFISVKPCAYTKEDTSICNGESVSLAIVDSFFNSFVWSPTTFLNDPNSANPIASPKHSIMYYVTATDTMGGSIYDSIFIHIRTCTPAISDTTICKGDEIIIGNNDSLYTSFLWSPIKYLNDPYSATPLASPPYNITYYVNSIDTMGNSDSDTVKIIVKDCGYLPDLIIPNAFTPNMDGLNDVFTYGNDEYWIIKTLIYNRWGELIFEGKTNQRWHGIHKDKKVSEDVYIYHISARAIGKDEERIYKGSVVLYY